MARDLDIEAMELDSEASEIQFDALMAEGDAITQEMKSVPAATSSDESTPQRTLTKEERENAERLAMKVAGGVLCTAGTAVALAGAGIVSAFKKDTKPLGDTWDWCKKNLFGTLRDM